MNAGAAEARGACLVFLHADSELPEGWAPALQAALCPPGCSPCRYALLTASACTGRMHWQCITLGAAKTAAGLLQPIHLTLQALEGNARFISMVVLSLRPAQTVLLSLNFVDAKTVARSQMTMTRLFAMGTAPGLLQAQLLSHCEWY